VIASYFAALEQGQQPDIEDWLRRHVEIAPELAAFLADKQLFERLAPWLHWPMDRQWS
jgi:hypothetical protein